ncbi:hypothetical protein RHSIM_Rhsim01G0160200 [Rhododendron simsii]|uniref:Protein FAR1-RELATED SEQUENCE n=1 Tax=Rhododendron simsii TaxID=118357 RepID=A0A834HF61_RHOSS|nr:hypothetical protein RHSIM_Rhsim01G0160200 [Rhododendron simsii]
MEIDRQEESVTPPPTNHQPRYCMWHRTNKFSKKISALAYKEHNVEFKNCIWNSETPEQFEAGWVEVFERALSKVRHNELDMDHKDVNEKPHLKTMYLMESTMSEFYTIEIFYMFQEELFQNVGGRTSLCVHCSKGKREWFEGS